MAAPKRKYKIGTAASLRRTRTVTCVHAWEPWVKPAFGEEFRRCSKCTRSETRAVAKATRRQGPRGKPKKHEHKWTDWMRSDQGFWFRICDVRSCGRVEKR